MADLSFIPLSSLHDHASDWFARAHAALLGAVPCRRGCSRCCIGPFAITVLDAGMLRRGLDGLSTQTRDEIEGRASSQIAAVTRAFPRLARSPFLDDWSDDEQDALATAFAEFPCPALDVDGCCRVYDARPVTCRTMGIPIEAGETVEGACEVQTTVPVVRLPGVLREEEHRLAEQEARELQNAKSSGEEILIAMGFCLSAPGQAFDQCGNITLLAMRL